MIWVLGGDRNPTEERHLATWRAMADGLDAGDGGRHLMTFHPQGGASSRTALPEESWIDFSMRQSRHHARDIPTDQGIAEDYAWTPVKPCLDGEPCYEDHPVDWRPEAGVFDDHDVRKAAYWSTFAGACGHAYGANGVFQCFDGQAPDTRFHATRRWEDALALPGAGQMRHLRHLLTVRSFARCSPDQDLLVDAPVDRGHRVRVLRARDGSFTLVYVPAGDPVTLRAERFDNRNVTSAWYDPRTGEVITAGPVAHDSHQTFHPPSTEPSPDWVLVLDGDPGLPPIRDRARPA